MKGFPQTRPSVIGSTATESDLEIREEGQLCLVFISTTLIKIIKLFCIKLYLW